LKIQIKKYKVFIFWFVQSILFSDKILKKLGDFTSGKHNVGQKEFTPLHQNQLSIPNVDPRAFTYFLQVDIMLTRESLAVYYQESLLVLRIGRVKYTIGEV